MRPIVIYTRFPCIWCFRAKRLLRKHGIRFEERDARDRAVRDALLERTGRHTVPLVFAGDELIGGFEDLRALVERGQLHEALVS